MEKIFTIGYEGRKIDECIQILKKNNINMVVDVRINPYSRKKGFSKKQLDIALKETGIEYIHLEELGNPEEIRNEYNKNGSTKYLYEQYTKYLEKHPEAIKNLISKIIGQSACLICYEKYPMYCHRGAITDYLHKKMKMRVSHL